MKELMLEIRDVNFKYCFLSFDGKYREYFKVIISGNWKSLSLDLLDFHIEFRIEIIQSLVLTVRIYHWKVIYTSLMYFDTVLVDHRGNAE